MAAPDMAITLSIQQPIPFSSEMPAKITVTAQNLGDVPASGSVGVTALIPFAQSPVAFYGNSCPLQPNSCFGPLDYCWFVPVLNPGESYACTFNVARRSGFEQFAGAIEVRSRVNTQADVNLSNNQATGAIQLGNIFPLPAVGNAGALLLLLGVIACYLFSRTTRD